MVEYVVDELNEQTAKGYEQKMFCPNVVVFEALGFFLSKT